MPERHKPTPHPPREDNRWAPRVTLQQIAQQACLSRSGVSRALRNDPRVPPQTCRKVQQLARKLGYRPDPELSSAFRLLGQRKSNRYVETLAFFTWHENPIEIAGNHYSRRLYHGALEHAEALGYKLEECWTQAPGMTGHRLQTILANRGVRGCLIAPLVKRLDHFDFDWSRFSVVAATTAFGPEIPHRARVSNFENTQTALREVRQLGYQRIGLLLDDYIHARSGQAIHAAFLEDHSAQRPRREAPVLLVEGLGPDPGEESGHSRQFDRFVSWCNRCKPDVILSSRVAFHPWLHRAGLACPGDVGFVSLEGVNPGQTLTHIDQHPDRVGAAGIDLLLSVLNRSKRDIPQNALCTTVAGSWTAGTSTRPRS